MILPMANKVLIKSGLFFKFRQKSNPNLCVMLCFLCRLWIYFSLFKVIQSGGLLFTICKCVFFERIAVYVSTECEKLSRAFFTSTSNVIHKSAEDLDSVKTRKFWKSDKLEKTHVGLGIYFTLGKDVRW